MIDLPRRYRDLDVSAPRPSRPAWIGNCRRLGISLGFLAPEEPRLAWREVAASYERPPSFVQFLPVRAWDPATRLFRLQDWPSCAAILELTAVDAEARTTAQLEQTLQAMVAAFSAIPQRSRHPWIVQCYGQDEPLLAAARGIRDYAREIGALQDRMTDRWLNLLRDHLIDIGQPAGIFEDSHTGVRWAGRQRRCRLVLYRRFDIRGPGSDRRALRELDELTRALGHGLEAAGVRARRIGAGEYTHWLASWFQPESRSRTIRSGPDPQELAPDHVFPDTWDLAWGVLHHRPESDLAQGVWRFQGWPHRYLPLLGFVREPRPGLLTLEGSAGRHRAAAFFDRLPPGTVFCQQIVFTPQDETSARLAFIHRRAGSSSADSQLVREQVEDSQSAMARGHLLFPTMMGFFLRGRTREELADRTERVASLCQEQGVQPLDPAAGIFPLDDYVRCLPAGWHPDFDRVLVRQRLDWLMNALAASPLWGKGGGSGKPGFTFFDRAGQPVQLDILHPADRDRAPHCLVIGPTGSGKSALLNYLALQTMALRRPHLFILDVGDSFRLLGDWFRAQGLSVHQVRLDRGQVALPPFASSARMLAEQVDPGPAFETAPEADAEATDFLGEMEAAARMILTGCDPREETHYTRQDRTFVRAALVDTAQEARHRGEAHASVSGFVDMLAQYAQGRDPWRFAAALGAGARERIGQLHDNARFFLDGVRGQLFDRPGDPWPEVDVTIVDFGRLAGQEDTRDILAIAFLGLMNAIQRGAERRRGSGRQSVVIIDECHVTTTNPLLAGYLTRGSKMWRKWGLWLWLATQSLADFPEDTRQMLNMAEFWFCLSMPREEVDEVARFRRLSEEERQLLEDARKSPGRYSEGILLSERPPLLLRIVPPALALALAQTEADEVAERQRLMEQHGLTEEIAAVELVAERIRQQRMQP